ncbi:hypothetical protein QM359_08380 [Streptococcus infantis]|jgi:hypothetical protein|uniref:hypothetical protein n=1 Tax=Streptococcus infantis TaxID=68892 RepID=UPI0039C1B8D5
MATRSFTTDLKFNRKSADNLISALSETKRFSRSKDVESTEISSLEAIRLMFAKGQNKRV